MRALFILYGAPGSGKSSLIQELLVEHLTIGFDHMRQLFAPFIPCVEDPGADQSMVETPVSRTMRLRQSDEFAAVQATFAAMESRMVTGATVFFDATSLNIRDQNEIIRRGHAHGYTPYIIDVQGDISFEELKERNRRRGSQMLSEDVLHEKWILGTKKYFAAGVKVLSATDPDALYNQIQSIQRTPQVDASRIVVVGDLHSCSAPLRQALEELDTPDTQWVFSGDLFDRGPDPVGVWKMITQLQIEQRCTVVTGNHESHLRTVNVRTMGSKMPQTVETRDALLAAGITAEQQLDFVNSTLPALLATVAGSPQNWLITHGGVGRQTADMLCAEGLLHVTDAECVYGLSERSLAYRGKSSYDVERVPLAGFQLHGHRNGAHGSDSTVEPIRDNNGAPIVCLESGAGTGQSVSVAVIEPGGVAGQLRVIQYADEVSPHLAARNALSVPRVDSVPQENLLERMIRSENVVVKPVAGFPGVVSANFTRQAFYRHAWDQDSVHARGLFLDAQTGEVLARGYEKFFHIDEAPGRTLHDLQNPQVTAYPITAVKKFNGYLALVGSIDGRLAVFSKSGRTRYAEVAEQMLLDELGQERAEQLRQMLEKARCTVLFEVLRSDDPHPIAERGEDRLVVLDAVCNTAEFRTSNQLADGIAHRFGFESARSATIQRAHRPEQLPELLRVISERTDEGAVLVDAQGYRSKVKATIYEARKSTRSALERYWSGKTETLGPKHVMLEEQLRATGVLADIRSGRFTVIGLDGHPHLDLAGVYDAQI